MIEISGVEEEWWTQRVQFLISRAETHLDQRSEVLGHRACAATLLRDAGCLLLLREEFGRGRQFLAQAGEQLVAMGLPAGLVLIAMDDPGRGRDALRFYRERDEVVSLAKVDAQADARGVARESIEFSARNSFGSMLSVVQADLLQEATVAEMESRVERREVERRELQQRHGAREVGATGLSVVRYLHVAASMDAEMSAHTGDAPGEVVRAIELVGRRREERIDAARRDDFHWRLVPRPAELLDLDCVVLMQVALEGGLDERVLREWTGWRRGEVIGAPLDVAAKLSGSAALGATD